jgi:hypothetical protein
MPTPTTTAWRLADQLAGGVLAETIVELKREGASDERIGHELYKQFGVEVTRSTITAWRRKLMPGSRKKVKP